MWQNSCSFDLNFKLDWFLEKLTPDRENGKFASDEMRLLLFIAMKMSIDFKIRRSSSLRSCFSKQIEENPWEKSISFIQFSGPIQDNLSTIQSTKKFQGPLFFTAE